MDSSRRLLLLELDYEVVPWIMSIDYGCAYVFAPYCRVIKMNPRPDYGQ
jgi:hypothetical protein